MKKTIKNLLVISIFIILICISGIVKADTVTMSLGSNSSQYRAGDTVILTLSINRVDSPTGISGITSKITYDENVFEKISDQCFEPLNNWSGVSNQYCNPETGLFNILRGEGQKNPGEILKIRLKVKENVSAESTIINIEFNDICAEDIDVNVEKPADVSVRLTKATSQATPTPTATPSTKPSTTPTPTTKATVTPTPTSSGKLPQTGEETVYVVLGMAVLLVISTISFIKYNNLKIK